MAETPRDPSGAEKGPNSLSGAAPGHSLVKWHLGALGFFLGGTFLVAGLENLKDYSASKEPLEYVFAVVWSFFVSLLPNVIYFFAAVYRVIVMRRHRNWTLPEFNRVSAVVLLTLAALPMLAVASIAVVGTLGEWIAAIQSGSGKTPTLLPLIGGLVVGSPWVYSQFKAWRTLLRQH